METIDLRRAGGAPPASARKAVILPFARPGAARMQERPAPSRSAPPPRRLTGQEQTRIDALRRLLAEARLRPRLNAAALNLEREPLGPSLLALLRDGAKKDIRLRNVGTATPSDDELWLNQMILAARAGDDVGLNVLIAMRLKPPVRRLAAKLIPVLARVIDSAGELDDREPNNGDQAGLARSTKQVGASTKARFF